MNQMMPIFKKEAEGLASLGRYGDSYMVHAAEGETVIPGEILDANPGLKEQLFRQMQMMGIENPNRYVVGSALNSLNPITGQPEFFWKKLYKATKRSLPAIGAILGGRIMPGAAGEGIGAGIGSLVSGKNLKKSAVIGGITGIGSAALDAFKNKDGKGFGKSFFDAVTENPVDAFNKGIFGKDAPMVSRFDKMGKSPTGTPLSEAETAFYNQSGAENPFEVEQSGPFASFVDSPMTGKEQATALFDPFKKDVFAPGITAALASEAIDPEKETLSAEDVAEARRIGDPQYSSYVESASLPQGSNEYYQARRDAGIYSTLTAEQLAASTGITLEQAQAYLTRKYGPTRMAADGGEIVGPGTGTSDSIDAKLSDGEFVMTAEAVRNAGNGDRDLGAARMYDMMSRFERGMA